MGLYEGLKDAMKVAQKADNIDLYKKLLDLGQEAIDLQEENRKLKEENYELRKEKDLENKIVFHKTQEIDSSHKEHPYITLNDDPKEIRYCAICWGRDKKLVPMYDELNCIVCLKKYY